MRVSVQRIVTEDDVVSRLKDVITGKLNSSLPPA